MELIRERFRTATVLFPGPEFQNLSSNQLEYLNRTIDQLIRLNANTKTIESDFLQAMRENDKF